MKEGPKVKSVHTRRFSAHDFLYVGLPSQTSRINNKQVISTFKFGADFKMMQMQKLGNNKFKDFSRIYSILAKFKDFECLENEAIFARIFKDVGILLSSFDLQGRAKGQI